MAAQSFFDQENNVIISSAEGKVESATIRTAAKSAIEIAEKHKCHRFVFDISKNAEGQTLLQGFLDMENMKKSLGFEFDDIIAVVFNPNLYSSDRADFIENVVYNRANPKFKMFTNIQKAITWLNSF